MADIFGQNILYIVVAQICEKIGFDKAMSTPLNVLADLLKEFILNLGKLSKHYAEHCSRLNVNLCDLSLAFHDCGVNPDELVEFLRNFSSLPQSMLIPKYPVAKINWYSYSEFDEHISDHSNSEFYEHLGQHSNNEFYEQLHCLTHNEFHDQPSQLYQPSENIHNELPINEHLPDDNKPYEEEKGPNYRESRGDLKIKINLSKIKEKYKAKKGKKSGKSKKKNKSKKKK